MISAIQSLYEAIGLEAIANSGDVAGILSVAFLTLVSFLQLITNKTKQIEAPQSIDEVAQEVFEKDQKPTEEVKVVKPSLSWSDRLKKGLSGSRNGVWGKIGNIFSGNALSEEQLEEIEELLYTSDIGPTIAGELIELLQEKAKSEEFTGESFKQFLKGFIKDKIGSFHTEVDEDLFTPHKNGKTKVIMIVGVNGAGKTTSIGKLATKLTNQGASVVVGACDTFRAAAVDQLAVWCERAGATMIRAKEGAGPSGVGYEALEKAISLKADYCILDTAGRLHTKENLMDELRKSKDVLKKLDANAPDHVILVIDAITGQNAIRQAEEFNKVLGLTGLILTKCDGSSKAGSAVSIVSSLKVPITYIGVGESVEDINKFDLDEYLDALLDL